VTVHSADCCLVPIPTNPLPNKPSVFDHLSAPTYKEFKSRRKRKARKPHLAAVSVNVTSRGRDLAQSQRGRQGVRAPSVSSPDPDYNPCSSQVLIEPEGAFRGTRSGVAIPYNYGQPSSSRAMSPELLRSLFQWSDNEGETSGYASSATISSEQMGIMFVNMADNNLDENLCR